MVTWCDTLWNCGVDHVVVTGNLTWAGRQSQLSSFRRLFDSFQSSSRLTVVPGNHDRQGDDLGRAIQGGPAVSVVSAPGLHLVRFDSTGGDDRAPPREQGRMTDRNGEAIVDAVAAAPPGRLVVLLMHHPILALLSEHGPERLLSWLGRSYEQDLERGRALLRGLRGRCDLVLHGHGGAATIAQPFAQDERRLLVLGGGSSGALGRARVLWHHQGRLVGEPGWLVASASGSSTAARPGCLQPASA